MDLCKPGGEQYGDKEAFLPGYTAPLSFYGAFRRRFGITPAQFRQRATS